jgi:Nitrile hydratase, alpha chain
MAEAPQTRKDLEIAITVQAWKDEAFRQELLSNPKAALAKVLGRPLPDDFQVFIHQESPKTIHLVLPQKPATTWSSTQELTDEQVGGLAAGACPSNASGTAGIDEEMEFFFKRKHKGPHPGP